MDIPTEALANAGPERTVNDRFFKVRYLHTTIAAKKHTLFYVSPMHAPDDQEPDQWIHLGHIPERLVLKIVKVLQKQANDVAVVKAIRHTNAPSAINPTPEHTDSADTGLDEALDYHSNQKPTIGYME